MAPKADSMNKTDVGTRTSGKHARSASLSSHVDEPSRARRRQPDTSTNAPTPPTTEVNNPMDAAASTTAAPPNNPPVAAGRPDINQIKPVTSTKHLWPVPPTHPFDFAELPDPSAQLPLIPGSRRWRFHARPPRTPGEHAMCRVQIMNTFEASIPDIRVQELKIGFITVPHAGRHVEIVFPNDKQYQAAASAVFKWCSQPMELVQSTAPLDKDQAVMRINRLRSNTDLKSFFGALRRQLQPFVEITDFYANSTSFEWKDPDAQLASQALLPNKVFSGTVFNLFRYRARYSAEDLPGFFRYDDYGDFHLHFLGRGDRCGFCKSRAREQHTHAECTFRRCEHCGLRGHVSNDYPERPAAR